MPAKEVKFLLKIKDLGVEEICELLQIGNSLKQVAKVQLVKRVT